MTGEPTADAALAQPESRSVTVNGLRLHYLDWGNPSAPALVAVHGYTGSADSFNGFARRFRDRFHIVAVDVRGHGESEWSPAAAYRYADQVSDLAGFVDALALARFTLVGTSMGGIIAMAYAGTHSDRLDRLVINDIGPDAEPGSARITANVSARPDDFESFEAALTQRAAGSANLAKRSIEDQRELARGVLREQPNGRWAWKLDPQYVIQRVQNGAEQRPPLWPVLEGLPCPALVLWAMNSDVLSEAQAERMVATLRAGTLVAVPDTEHAPSLVEPAAVDSLERFLGA